MAAGVGDGGGGGSEAKQMLPVPSEIMEMFGDGVQYVESPSEHQGRKRSFPHVRGNWASHVYIPVPVSSVFYSCVERLRDHLGEGWYVCEAPLHVSVSRTVPLKHHWIEPLRSELQRQMRRGRRFEYGLNGFSVYVNEECTRTFLSLDVISGNEVCLFPQKKMTETLMQLVFAALKFTEVVREVDKCFLAYSLPSFYKPPSFHASILWCLGDKGDFLHPQKLEEIEDLWSEITEEEEYDPAIRYIAMETHFKCGNKLFSLPLQQ